MTPQRLVLAAIAAAMLALVGCGSVGYQTTSGGPGGQPAQNLGQRGAAPEGMSHLGAQGTGAVAASEVGVGPNSILVGDANLNGIPDVADAIIMRRVAAGLQEIPTNRYLDLTGDGKVTVEDCRLLERAIAGHQAWPIRSIGSALVLDLAPDLQRIDDGYSPVPVEIPHSGTFTVDLWALEVADFAGFELRIDLGASPGIRIDEIRPGAFIETGSAQVTFDAEVDGDSATITCRLSALSSHDLPRGEGIVAHIDFTALQPGSETEVALSLLDEDPTVLSQGQDTLLHGALVRIASR